MLRYSLTAGVLGVGWFVVLLVPGITRNWLLENPGQNLVCLVVTSVVMAVACRRYVARAYTFREHLVRATVLPYAGCFLFLSFWAAMPWVQSLWRDSLANIHDTLSLYGMGMTAAVVSFFVVIPYGLLCQYAMHAASRAAATSSHTEVTGHAKGKA